MLVEVIKVSSTSISTQNIGTHTYSWRVVLGGCNRSRTSLYVLLLLSPNSYEVHFVGQASDVGKNRYFGIM